VFCPCPGLFSFALKRSSSFPPPTMNTLITAHFFDPFCWFLGKTRILPLCSCPFDEKKRHAFRTALPISPLTMRSVFCEALQWSPLDGHFPPSQARTSVYALWDSCFSVFLIPPREDCFFLKE